MSPRIVLIASLVLLALGITVVIVNAQRPPPGGRRAPAALAGTGFTYQGQLKNNGALANGTCDFQFGLWDASSLGMQVGTTQTVSSLPVTNGLFTTSPIDFGNNAFQGDARWLGIAVSCPSGGSFTALSPRQALTPAPYALALPGLYTQQNVYSPNIIGGFNGNTVSPGVYGATIAGGGQSGFINQISVNFGTIGGGAQNNASSLVATIGGGQSNIASANWATIGGGAVNTASGNYATIPGGWLNTAAGNNSFAAGYYALAQHNGTFVFSDISCTFFCLNPIPFTSTVANEFAVRSTGGARFVSAVNSAGTPTAGVQLAAGGGSWSSLSDRNVKANFETINPREVVAHVVALPIQTWNYQSQDPSIRHIGPMAQDFYTAFKVGEDDTHITGVDAEGVAFAAIQGLYQIVQEKDAEISDLKSQVASQREEIDALKSQNGKILARLDALEQMQPSPYPLPNREREIGLALVIGAVGVIAIERARKGGAR